MRTIWQASVHRMDGGPRIDGQSRSRSVLWADDGLLLVCWLEVPPYAPIVET